MRNLKIIYIPLWLDLLSFSATPIGLVILDLHSTMVRFIILIEVQNVVDVTLFTFHYG